MLKQSYIVHHNAPYMVLNWVKNLVWYDNPENVTQFLRRAVDHYTDLTGQAIKQDCTYPQVRKIILRYVSQLTDDYYFGCFMDRLYFTYIAKEFADFRRREELPFENLEEFRKFIHDEIVHVLEQYEADFVQCPNCKDYMHLNEFQHVGDTVYACASCNEQCKVGNEGYFEKIGAEPIRTVTLYTPQGWMENYFYDSKAGKWKMEECAWIEVDPATFETFLTDASEKGCKIVRSGDKDE